MDKCLNCGHGIVSEYESQICMQCAGELPARVLQRFSIRSILTTLHVDRPRRIVETTAAIGPTIRAPSPRRP
ncbi:MAG: hypothetical protein JSR66_25970 [Proteobacteria bacterium]|nr:hypothetical protein [Pseudomonadota bacterium]